MNMNDTVNSTTDSAPTAAPEPPPLPPTPSPPKAASSPRRARRSDGKVARLPLEIRNMVNQALRDGRRYSEIIGLLAAQGFPGFKSQNLSNWFVGGFREWLAVQERFEAKRPLSDKAQAML